MDGLLLEGEEPRVSRYVYLSVLKKQKRAFKQLLLPLVLLHLDLKRDQNLSEVLKDFVSAERNSVIITVTSFCYLLKTISPTLVF